MKIRLFFISTFTSVGFVIAQEKVDFDASQLKDRAVSPEVLVLSRKHGPRLTEIGEATALNPVERIFKNIGELMADKSALVAKDMIWISQIARSKLTSSVANRRFFSSGRLASGLGRVRQGSRL